MAKLYKYNKADFLINPSNGSYFELSELLDILNCELINLLPLNCGAILIIDSDCCEKYNYPKDVNKHATNILSKHSGTPEEMFYLRKEYIKKGVLYLELSLHHEEPYILADAILCFPEELTRN